MPTPKELKLNWLEVTVPTASVKTLVATDYEIIPAPGAGKAILLLSGLLTLDFNSIAYTWANTDHSIGLGNFVTDSDAEAQALIESADRYTLTMRQAVDSAELVENTAVKLTAAGTGEPAAGDSPLLVKVLYAIVDVTE